jgi:FixJ family two-component response regulator
MELGGVRVQPGVAKDELSPESVGPVVVGVVDDDPSVLKALSRLLRSAGFVVVTFVSAEDFLARFRHSTLACVVLDIHLGEMSGLDLQAYLADAGVPLPIVFITAHDDPQTRGRVEKSHQPYLRKPVDEKALLDAIAVQLRSGVGPSGTVKR